MTGIGHRLKEAQVEVGSANGPLVLEAGDVRARVLPADGGRLASVTVGGLELLVTSSQDGPIYWGSYPMAPWAGRIRHGRFTYAGSEYQLPITMPPHAIHGVVHDRPWEVIGPDAIAIDLDDRWPFRGRMTQRFAVTTDGIEVSMTLDADEPMPAVLGWHPWFRRVLADGREPVRLTFEPGSMLVRDAEGMPTGERVPPTPGPWDDAFTDLRSDPVLDWPGTLRMTLASTCPWWWSIRSPSTRSASSPRVVRRTLRTWRPRSSRRARR